MKKVMTTVVKFVLFFFGWALVSVFIPLLNADNQAIWRLWAEITPLLSISIFSVAFWLIEKKSIKLYLFCHPIRGIFIGGVAGSLWLSIAAFLNVIMQELLIRGYLYQMIKQNHNMVSAIFVTTGLFVALHGGAFEAGLIPVLNVLSMSLLMTVVLEYTGGLIAPTIMHAVWNIVGSIVLDGVSLADDYPHLVNASFSGNTLLSGGNCKIEGSVVVLILNILLISFFLLKMKRNRKLSGCGCV